MTERRHPIAAALIALPFGLTAALPAAAGDIVESARQTAEEQFQIDGFAAALEASGVAEELREGGPYTVFAPTNPALAQLEPVGAMPPASDQGEEPLADADKEHLAEILRAHIVEGELTFEELMGQDTLETLGGTELQVSSAKGGILVNEIEIVHSDIAADNGVIHIIGGILTAPGPEGTGQERQQ
jgi:uncharacterized surface protein with fasciclin (FAS1) repeats